MRDREIHVTIHAIERRRERKLEERARHFRTLEALICADVWNAIEAGRVRNHVHGGRFGLHPHVLEADVRFVWTESESFGYLITRESGTGNVTVITTITPTGGPVKARN